MLGARDRASLIKDDGTVEETVPLLLTVELTEVVNQTVFREHAIVRACVFTEYGLPTENEYR